METKRPTNEAAEEILGLYFPVLDHGFISLVDYMGTDESIESAARVSYGAGTRKRTQTRGLLRYLKRNLHSSPSEMVMFKFHVCCPIFVMRQWIRHRMSSTNEYSGRYSLMPMLFYMPPEEQFKSQSKNNNQGRGDELGNEKHKAAVLKWNELRKQSASFYEDLIQSDVARELARIDLPLSTYTQFYWKIDLHNLLHFLGLRVDSHAQWEIQEFGKIMAGMLKCVAPLSYEAWIDYDVCGTNLSRMELDAIRKIIHVDMFDDGVNLFAQTDVVAIKNNDYGLTKREIKELHDKLSANSVPDFELDLSQAKSPEYFQEKMLAAVPNIDKE